MDKDDSENSEHVILKTRGRPRNKAQKPVHERLLEATELLLRDHTHFELTERKIVTAAGTKDAMIHYYFGDKDGLLFDVIVRYYDDVMARLKALDTLDPALDHITYDIFRILIDAYYARPWITRMALSEFARGRSAIKEAFMKKYGTQGQGLVRVRRLMEHLIECGVYDRKTNAAYASLSMYSMILSPLFLAPFSEGTGFELDQRKKDEWIDHVATLFDRQFRPAK